MELLMIYKISPNPSLLKRGEREKLCQRAVKKIFSAILVKSE